jgi:ribosomal protein S18 acetylase RimI-like enzyme
MPAKCPPVVDAAVIPKPTGPVRDITTPFGLLRTRLQTDADESFLFQLFESVKGAEFAQMPIQPTMKSHLLRMQYNAMSGYYRASYPGAVFAIIALDDTSIGRVIWDTTQNRLHIVYIAFMPNWRHLGFGTALMRVLMDQAQSLNMACEASVAVDNTPSLCFWAKLGFLERTRDLANVVVAWHPAITTT